MIVMVIIIIIIIMIIGKNKSPNFFYAVLQLIQLPWCTVGTILDQLLFFCGSFFLIIYLFLHVSIQTDGWCCRGCDCQILPPAKDWKTPNNLREFTALGCPQSLIYPLLFPPILQHYHISERFQRATKRGKFLRAAWEFDFVLNSRQ